MFDAAIHSNKVITPQGVIDATVVITKGKIEEVISGKLDSAVEVGDKVLMPGIVDPHVHINEPGRTNWEGFETATKAAVAGGITTLVDMPLNSSPVTTSVKAFEEKINACIGKLHCHVGFWGGVIPGNEKEIEPLIEKGVLGFKAFLVHSGIDEFPNVAEHDLRKAMPIIVKHNLPLLVHCELTKHVEYSPAENPVSYKNYLHSRARKWEDDAIALMIRLCEEFNCRVHIVHLSSSDSLEQIKKAKQKGLPLTVETGQHYLYFSAEDIADGRTDFKCAPPIREKENNEKLWKALKKGLIDFVATDHSPCTPEMKEMQRGDFMKAWGGIASLQFALPVLWTAAGKQNCSIEQIARWLCENPAKLPGLENIKGKIQKGFDADLVVWNPDKTFFVTEKMIEHRHKITPYLNEELYGVVEQTWLAGRKVYEAGKFLHLNKGRIILNNTKKR
ncbi:MAG: allantoinase AllB [Chitinophagaceae bacterium]